MQVTATLYNFFNPFQSHVRERCNMSDSKVANYTIFSHTLPLQLCIHGILIENETSNSSFNYCNITTTGKGSVTPASGQNTTHNRNISLSQWRLHIWCCVLHSERKMQRWQTQEWLWETVRFVSKTIKWSCRAWKNNMERKIIIVIDI